MAYDLNKVSSRKQSPYITYGSGQVLKINKIELVSSKSTGSSKAVLHMETEPINDDTFEPVDGAKGKVGKIGCGVYMKHERQKIEFLEKMKEIAVALGLGDEISKVKGDSFEEVVAEIENVLTGNKFARYTIFGEEYPKSNGTVGLRLMFPRWSFVESVDTDPSKIIPFDPNNPKHLTKIKREEAQTNNDDLNDLPF